MLLLMAVGRVAAEAVMTVAEEGVQRVALELAAIRVLVPVNTEWNKFIEFISRRNKL